MKAEKNLELNKLSREQKNKYVRDNGVRCPYCNTYYKLMVKGVTQTDGINACQDVRCIHCGKEWRDIFVLCDIEELNS